MIDAPQLLGNLDDHFLQGTGHLVARATRAATFFGLVIGAEPGFAAQIGAMLAAENVGFVRKADQSR